MRKILSNSSEVFHFWANKVQSEGRAGNVFFDSDKVYSYGSHFCIARHLPNGVVAFTTRSYSNSTAKHIYGAMRAANHIHKVYCNDPSESGFSNMRHAQQAIVEALNDAEKPRIRQLTRDKCKARALKIAEQANEYLHALPESERMGCTRFDTTGLEHIRVVMQEHEETQRRMAAEAAIERNREAAERLIAWRVDPTIYTNGFYALPVALRLRTGADQYPNDPAGTHWLQADKTVIQTSHGAEIPVSFASRLWAMIEAVRSTGRAMENIGKPCGVYTLNTIRADGSIVVGCHDIPYAEIQRIAVLLGFVAEATTV
jgi:hypothetical protein